MSAVNPGAGEPEVSTKAQVKWGRTANGLLEMV